MKNAHSARSQSKGPFDVALILVTAVIAWGSASQTGFAQSTERVDLATILHDSRSSIASIRSTKHTIRCRLEVQSESHSEAVSRAADVDASGRFLLYELHVVEDRSTHRAKFTGRHFLVSSQRPELGSYRHFERAFDGIQYQTFDIERRSGFVSRYHHETTVYCTLSILLGDNLVAADDPRPSLVDWLNDPVEWQVLADEASQVTLERTVSTEAIPTPLRIQVSLSRNHGFLPCAAEIFFCDTQTMSQRIKVTKFIQTGAHQHWIPVSGTHEAFYRDPILPEGITQESYARMSDSDREAVDRLVKWQAKPLVSKNHLEVEEQSIELNPELTGDDFLITYPRDARILREIDSDGNPVPRKRQERLFP
ncbi:hypothetical protein [Planctomicrobium piriforme]|uniref:Uncharacterized protein n=1 Tax=Planctomicrobium piriforme TaxID=1576369 RepID=A0A1I3FCI7_9PLAN|nr:hypothetical protein [Planctomicrobium piriforme]SFI08943.1 hypothetical protein SAMN05421753_105179 [Planctomicrobium piriforme]